MKTAKDLMLGYIDGGADQAGALFARDGTLELPYLASIGMPPVIKGPEAISKFLTFLHGTLYPGFSFEGVQIHIDTPDQVLAEYHINRTSGISGKAVRQQFFGHLLAENGQIKRVREAIAVIYLPRRAMLGHKSSSLNLSAMRWSCAPRPDVRELERAPSLGAFSCLVVWRLSASLALCGALKAIPALGAPVGCRPRDWQGIFRCGAAARYQPT
jgi:hypothetical protein